MLTSKLSVSLDGELEREIKRAASEAEMSVSAWMSEAALERLRRERWREYLLDWELRFGRLTNEELAEADREIAAARRKQTGRAS